MAKGKSGYQVTITPQHKMMELHLKETWKKRELIGLFVKRDFVTRYKQTILGPLWAIIQPLMTTIVFTFVFGEIANLSISDEATSAICVPSFLFYMLSNLSWSYFAGCLGGTSNTFGSNAGLFGKVYFPRLVAPISTVVSNLVTVGIQFAMFLVFWGIFQIPAFQGGEAYSYHISLFVLMVPLLIVQTAMLGMGLGLIVSSFTVKYRDLAMLIGFIVSLWHYVTPVAYGLTLVSESETLGPYLWLYMLNPMTPIVTTFRCAFFGEGYFELPYYLISVVITLAVFFLGIVLFSRTERTFMDTI